MMQTSYGIPTSHTEFEHRICLDNSLANHTGSIGSTVIFIHPDIRRNQMDRISTYFHSQTLDDIRVLYKEYFVRKLEKAIQEAEEDKYGYIETIDDLITLLNNRAKKA